MVKKEVQAVTKKLVKKNGHNNVDNGKKNSFAVRFMTFCHGVRSEFGKVHWPTKKDMIKYSVATVAFILFCSIFFYLIEVIFALVRSLFN